MPTPPHITPLPDAPSRAEGPVAFNAKADPFIAALPPFGDELNVVVDYLSGITADATEAVEAAGIAVAARDVATAAANNAAASATAAESAPGSIGNLALLHAVALSF